jgi:hypothetical protein
MRWEFLFRFYNRKTCIPNFVWLIYAAKVSRNLNATINIEVAAIVKCWQGSFSFTRVFYFHSSGISIHFSIWCLTPIAWSEILCFNLLKVTCPALYLSVYYNYFVMYIIIFEITYLFGSIHCYELICFDMIYLLIRHDILRISTILVFPMTCSLAMVQWHTLCSCWQAFWVLYMLMVYFLLCFIPGTWSWLFTICWTSVPEMYQSYPVPAVGQGLSWPSFVVWILHCYFWFTFLLLYVVLSNWEPRLTGAKIAKFLVASATMIHVSGVKGH